MMNNTNNRFSNIILFEDIYNPSQTNNLINNTSSNTNLSNINNFI